MNQILYTGKNKNSGNNNKTIIIFAIFIIIFAICLILLGTFIFSKTNGEEDTKPSNNIDQTPVIENVPKIDILFTSVPGKVQVNIKSELDIEKATYHWDNETDTELEISEDKKNIETQIVTKQGTHILYITVTDIEGNEETKEQKVIGDSVPEVKISTDGVSNYVITAKDDEMITKIIVDLNGVKTEVDVNQPEYEYKVEIPEGNSVIEVIVYNQNNLTATKKAKINGFVK